MSAGDGMDNGPINGFVVMDRYIAKTDGFLQAERQFFWNNAGLGQDVKGIAYGFQAAAYLPCRLSGECRCLRNIVQLALD
jgi:hypothetical protein